MRLRPPWWFCCGWFSPWCLVDTVLHELALPAQWVCDRHDAAVDRHSARRWPERVVNWHDADELLTADDVRKTMEKERNRVDE